MDRDIDRLTKEQGRHERRRFPRFAKVLHVKMFVHDPNEPTNIANFSAKTLDFSHGGFRLESPRRFAAGSIVGFVFDYDLPDHVVSKVGEVRWCHPSRKEGRFELGMAVYP
ncbi:MAG: PilZ domain-containing protein [Desulfobulbaceae bacterium]|jgi:hypothetical protein|nr:PilZ domain-containing protein [Desulfobulbaceae bacterium]MDY0350961.1 PilZ domain-containing protein [Desulfobulbaceae bacterium]